MSPNITSKSPQERVLWQRDGKVLKAKPTVGGGVSLIMASQVDGCGARVVDVPAEALAELSGFLSTVDSSGVAQSVATVAMIDSLRSFEGDAVTILPDDPGALTATTQAAVEVNADWTHYRDRRFYGRTWQEALRSAHAARDGTMRMVEDLSAPAGMTADVHEGLLAASGQSIGAAK